MAALHQLSLTLLLLALSAIVRADDIVLGEEGSVGNSPSPLGNSPGLTLVTDETFEEKIKSPEFIVVVFYAPWCHHCAEVLDILVSMETELATQGIQFARVDIDQSPQLKTRFSVSQVPDVRIFRRGVASPYTGPSEQMGRKAIMEYFLEERSKPFQEGALELTNENFDNIVNSAPLMLVEFHADWCVPCQQLEPHFQAAAKRLRSNDPVILLGQVKVPEEMEVAKRYGMSGYPLLLVFRHGEKFNYTGPREENGIVNYMKRQVGPVSNLLSSLEDVRRFSRSKTETRGIAFFDSENEKLSRFMSCGNGLRMDLELGHSLEPEVAREMGFEINSIVIYHPTNLVSEFETGYSVISDIPSKSEKLLSAMLSHARPLVGHMTPDNQISLYGSRPLLVAYFELSWDLDPKNIRHWHNLIASVAKDYTAKLTFVIADEADFPTDLKLLGLADSGEDVAVGIFAGKNIRYSLDDELTKHTLREFVDDFLSGELHPHLNSEPVPKPSKASIIKKVVGKSFRTFLSETNNHRLLKLCMPGAPDCGEAEKYFPKVVSRYQETPNIMFAEMNLALNDLPPSVNIEGELPTFLFVKKGSHDPTQVTPKPTDENDLVFFLKVRQSIKPSLSEQDIKLRSKYKKSGSKRKKNKGKDEL